MEPTKKILTLLSVLLFVLFIIPDARCDWWLDDGEEEILLERSDLGEDSPKHKSDIGTYGIWDEYDNWNTVMQVVGTPEIYAPWTTSDIIWHDGPDFDCDEQPDWLLDWTDWVTNWDEYLPTGYENWTTSEWWDWYYSNAGHYDAADIWRQWAIWWDLYA